MFAPPVARTQTKRAAGPAAKPARQARFLPSTIRTQAAPRPFPQRTGASWDFSKMSLLPPERANRFRGSSPRPGIIQPKLIVGQADDPLEHEADRVADQVMRAPDPELAFGAAAPQISRKCAACEKEEQTTLQTKRAGPTEAAAGQGSAIVHEVLRSPGQPLDPAIRGFFEPRFGHDFGEVRVHHDERAAASARSVGARAYTVGRDIVFGRGEYAAGTNAGRRFLAHELAHTVQQGRAPASQPRMQRKLMVSKPADMIDTPGGKGAVQTNAATIDSYLKTLCPSGTPSVDPATGEAKIDPSFCAVPALPPGMAGPPGPSGAQQSKTSTGCGCICDLAGSPNLWKITVDDKSWPHTDFDDRDKANGVNPGGSGGNVTAPSPNSTKLWGAATASGTALNIDPWLVLGHELCGHAWLGNSGMHGPDAAATRGEGGHQQTVARENALRAEHGIDLRGTFKDPQCGESFWRSKTSPGTVNWSTARALCIKWREAYNKAHKANYKITDTIP